MKIRVFLLLMLTSATHFTGLAQEVNNLNEEESIKEEIWKVVEKRNSTWVENDFKGHMSIYHPDFRRWTLHSKTLMTKDIFASFWDGIKKNEEVIKIDIERKEMQILDDGNLAIAHYTIDEYYKWIEENKTNDEGITIRKGQIMNGKLRFSDIYIKVDNKWLYIGGHRDKAFLKEN
ncbi:MAG: nuclear transport factor 2 family protein [Psychroserpens sp.]|uniref:nuclear transport factor 2 family protein n=1 Tax=Psychroserpens sp. TaxID=2020870 RepID=UPI0030019DEA